MKKFMIISLITITPLITTPAHSVSPEVIKLALAGTARVASTAYVVQDNGINIPWLVLHWGSRSILEKLMDASNSLLIQGGSKALIGYSRILLHNSLYALIDSCKFSSEVATLCHLACWIRMVFAIAQALDGTQDVIDGIAEQVASRPPKEETKDSEEEPRTMHNKKMLQQRLN